MHNVIEETGLKKEFLRVSEVARKLHISPQIVYIWIKQGVIPGYKISKTYLIPKDEFLEFLEKRRYSPGK